MIIIKKFFEYIGIIGICLLSFYYTEKVALYVKSKNPIMRSIKDLKDSLDVNYINSTIIDSVYIIPGLNGQELNTNKSFRNMQEKSIYDENKLVFNEIRPTVSIEDNKDKIIIRGNKEKNSVALIFEKVNNLTKYLHQNNYKINVLINEENYDLNYELINDSNSDKVYTNIEYFLTKNKVNKNLCYIKNDNIPKNCEGKYLFKPSLTINHSNISTEKNKISSGEIILIKDSISLTELNIILNQIKYQDLKIVPLSELISESNSE